MTHVAVTQHCMHKVAPTKCLLRKLIADSRIVCNDSFSNVCIHFMIGNMRCTLSWDAPPPQRSGVTFQYNEYTGQTMTHTHTDTNGLGYYDFAKQFAISLMLCAGFSLSLTHTLSSSFFYLKSLLHTLKMRIYVVYIGKSAQAATYFISILDQD